MFMIRMAAPLSVTNAFDGSVWKNSSGSSRRFMLVQTLRSLNGYGSWYGGAVNFIEATLVMSIWKVSCQYVDEKYNHNRLLSP